MKPYRRILLKLSGEMLQGQQSFGIDPHFLNQVAHVLKVLALQGIEIGIVMGGGNLFRGETLAKAGMNQEQIVGQLIKGGFPKLPTQKLVHQLIKSS